MFVKKLTRQVVSEPDFPVARTRAGLLRGRMKKAAGSGDEETREE